MEWGRINSIESFSGQDGPGLRLVFFLQGCPLRCIYCHNPETWSGSGGKQVHVDELVQTAWRCRTYFSNGGGVTVSGGEPLMQLPFVHSLFSRLRQLGLSTVLDTSGWGSQFYPISKVHDLLHETDLVLLDIKAASAGDFVLLTGQPAGPLLSFLQACTRTVTPVRIRQVIVPGLNDRTDHLAALVSLLDQYPALHLESVELLGYHTLGLYKWKNLGLTSQLLDCPAMPPDQLSRLQAWLEARLEARLTSGACIGRIC